MPERIAQLPRDARGYPIPYVVQRDQTGQPLFIVNNRDLANHCVRRKLCSICGEKMVKELWFVGGPQSAFHPHGAYYDSAMHHDCLQYALRVCPYMAMSKQAADLDRVMPKIQDRLKENVLMWDPTINDRRPDLFVAVMAYGQSLTGSPMGGFYLHPLRPYHAVEYWREGEQLTADEGLAIVRAIRDMDLAALASALRLVLR
jgi:hypothetical protein